MTRDLGCYVLFKLLYLNSSVTDNTFKNYFFLLIVTFSYYKRIELLTTPNASPYCCNRLYKYRIDVCQCSNYDVKNVSPDRISSSKITSNTYLYIILQTRNTTYNFILNSLQKKKKKNTSSKKRTEKRYCIIMFLLLYQTYNLNNTIVLLQATKIFTCSLLFPYTYTAVYIGNGCT